jgi:hypothetical protein
MSTYQQFNGWSIIPMPSSPAPKQIDFAATDAVGMTQSSFTGQSQIQQFPGADFWSWNVSLPAMSRRQACMWIAFLMAHRGKANVFQLGDPLGRLPMGSASGTPVLDGVQAAMATTITTRGWTANATGVLLPGDYLQIGYRLHQVAQATNVDADANGKASIEIWPSLREAVADGTSIITTGTTGLFRLADNRREWSVNTGRLYGLSFKVIEAR